MRHRWRLWFAGFLLMILAYAGFSLMNARAWQANEEVFNDWQTHNRTLQTLEINEQQAAMVYEDAVSAGESAGSRWSDMVDRMAQMGLEINAEMKIGIVLSRDIQPALAELNYENTLLQYEATRNDLTLSLRNKVNEVIEAGNTVQKQLTALSLAQTALAQGKSQYQQGLLEDSAYWSLQYQVEQAEANLSAAQRAFEVAQIALNTFVGVDPDVVYDLESGEAQNDTPLESVDYYITQALSERPEIKLLAGQIAIKEEELAAYERIFEDVEMEEDTLEQYQAVKDELKRLNVEKQLAAQELEKEIRSLYLEIKLAQEEMSVLWDLVRAATDTNNQVLANYEKGAVLETQKIEAESQLITAKENYQASIYQYNTLRLQLDYAIAAGYGGAK